MTARGTRPRFLAASAALLLLGAGCSTAPPSAAGPAPLPVRDVACVTRTLLSGVHFMVLEHHIKVADQAVLAFLQAHPQIEGRLTLQELLFLECLAETPNRVFLLGEPDRPGAPVIASDPVVLIKVALIRVALTSSGFREQIADSLRKDALDDAGETGGLVVLSDSPDNPLRLLDIPSTEIGDDHSYLLPYELFTAGSLAIWHNHAFNPDHLSFANLDNSPSSHPSGTAHGPLEAVWGDRWTAWLQGIDGLVFAPTGMGKFSVVFYGAEEEEIELGQYSSE